jgi:hypothetical protein
MDRWWRMGRGSEMSWTSKLADEVGRWVDNLTLDVD